MQELDIGHFSILFIDKEEKKIAASQAVPTSAPAYNEVNTGNTSTSVTATEQNSALSSVTNEEEKTEDVTSKQTTAIQKELLTKQPKDSTATSVPVLINDEQIMPVEKEEKESVVVREQKKSEPVITEAPTEEKKTLRDKIFGMFRKKSKDEKNEASPVEEKNHVHKQANLAEYLSIRFSIPTNAMMGIRGAKLTLTNKSSETIVKATIVVIYYNDNNELLDKKMVSFARLEAGKSLTIPILDHATATHLDYNIISVAGEN